MNRQEYRRAEGTLRNHPDWSDQLVAEATGVGVEDVALVREAIESGTRPEPEAAS